MMIESDYRSLGLYGLPQREKIEFQLRLIRELSVNLSERIGEIELQLSLSGPEAIIEKEMLMKLALLLALKEHYPVFCTALNSDKN